jgi:hypothetical protein
MSVDLKARAAQAVELAQNAGAEDAWSTVSQSRDVHFEYRDGNLEKVKDTTAQSLGIRIYANGRYSSHATTDLNPGRLQDFIAEAVAITAALEPDEYRRITPESLFRDRPGDELDLVDASVQALEREQRIAWCKALDGAAHQHKDVISATSGVYDGTQRSASASSTRPIAGSERSLLCGTAVTSGLRTVSMPAARMLPTCRIPMKRAAGRLRARYRGWVPRRAPPSRRRWSWMPGQRRRSSTGCSALPMPAASSRIARSGRRSSAKRLSARCSRSSTTR